MQLLLYQLCKNHRLVQIKLKLAGEKSSKLCNLDRKLISSEYDVCLKYYIFKVIKSKQHNLRIRGAHVMFLGQLKSFAETFIKSVICFVKH